MQRNRPHSHRSSPSSIVTPSEPILSSCRQIFFPEESTIQNQEALTAALEQAVRAEQEST